VKDASIGGFLEGEGKFLDSIDYMKRLWLEYPDTPVTESAYFALSQSLYNKASKGEKVFRAEGPALPAGRSLSAGVGLSLPKDYIPDEKARQVKESGVLLLRAPSLVAESNPSLRGSPKATKATSSLPFLTPHSTFRTIFFYSRLTTRDSRRHFLHRPPSAVK